MGALQRRADETFSSRHQMISSHFYCLITFVENASDQAFNARLCDVRKDNLMVLLSAAVRPGSIFEMVFGDKHIPMVVTYCIPDVVRQGWYHCGFQNRSSASENLVSLFSKKTLV